MTTGETAAVTAAAEPEPDDTPDRPAGPAFWQCRVAHAVRFFGDAFRDRFGLEKYHDATAPAIFRGLYTENDYKKLWEHEGPALVIWCGADGQRLDKRHADVLRRQPNIKHLAMSKSLARDLDRVGLPYRRVNLHGSDLTGLELAPIGTNVYVFLPKTRAEIFRPDVIAEVRKRLPGVPFVVVDSHLKHSREQLVEIYRAAAIGLRLTAHDGCANTVLELGMMGRYVVHNGDQPNAIRWRNVPDIAQAIRQQLKKSGRAHKWMPAAMREYLALPEGWLTVAFWE